MIRQYNCHKRQNSEMYPSVASGVRPGLVPQTGGRYLLYVLGIRLVKNIEKGS